MSVYVAAALVAALAAFGATSDPRVPYWWRWDPAALVCALAVIYVIYGLGGALLAGLLEHAGLRLLSGGAGRGWANGAFDGTIAFFLMRLPAISVVFSVAAPAQLLVDLFLKRFGGWLETSTERAVARKVAGVQLRGLFRAVIQAFQRHVEPTPELRANPGAAALHLAGLIALYLDAASEVREAGGEAGLDDDAFEVAALESLRFWLQGQITSNKDATIDLSDD